MIKQIIPTNVASMFLMSNDVPNNDMTPCLVYCWYENTILKRKSNIAKPINPRPSFFLLMAFPTNVTPNENKLISERKTPTGNTFPYLLNSLTPPGVKSLTHIPENGATLPTMVSPRTKNTPIGINAILVAKKKRSIHFDFSDPTTIVLKNLRRAQTIPMRIQTKWNLYP